MEWNEWQRVLKWRALEDGDADGVLVNARRRREATARGDGARRRREATAHTRAGLASEEIKGDALDERSESFLDKRAEWLEREAIGWRGELIRVLELLRVPQGRWSWGFDRLGAGADHGLLAFGSGSIERVQPAGAAAGRSAVLERGGDRAGHSV